jgi:hypothetical protein
MGRLAPIALMPAGALAVHQLRYLLAFHGSAGIALERQGHSYLHSLAPWIVLGLAVGFGTFVRALGRALGGRCSLPRYAVSFAALWMTCSACLVAIYVAQELLEGLLATGHPAGLIGVFGYGGWWSIPAALGVGLVLAASFHGAQWVIHEVARRRAGRLVPAAARPTASLGSAGTFPIPRLAPVAGGWSDRGPPR